MESITLNSKQQRRLQVITRLVENRISIAEAAQVLGISTRQVFRLLAKYRNAGVASLVHGNTGKTPINKTEEAEVKQIVTLAGVDGKYHEFNTCHLCDVLRQHEGMEIGRSTLDRILRQQQLLLPKRRKPAVKRSRRDRCCAEGEMLQIDGSLHDWLQGRGPRLCLLGAIDDATGKILYLHFRPTEDQTGYLLMLRQIATTYGLPLSFYHDRHTILRSPKEPDLDDQLAGRQPQSQIQRVLATLGVQSIAAHSPQAKGRIERLWGTLQDRLCKELRVAGIATVAAANDYLPLFIERFNERFAQSAAEEQSAWVRLAADTDLDYYFSTCEERTVRQDHTISWQHQDLLILRNKGENSLAGKRISVHVTATGNTILYQEKERLRHCMLPAGQRAMAKPPASAAPVTTTKPNPQARARQMAYLHAGL